MDFLFGQPTRLLAVAVAFDPDHGFFLSFNPRWKGYAFPMRKVAAEDDALMSAAALDALREAAELPLAGASAKPLTYLRVQGVSGRTGARTVYRMHVYEVDMPLPLSMEVPTRGFACRRGFLRPEGFATADLLSWNTRAVVGELLDNQEVALAVICRRGPAGAEFLMLRYPNYGGYFPPASRIRTDVEARYEAQKALRQDTGYRARVTAGETVEARDEHFSPRYDCRRTFVFHLVQLALSDRIDLNDADNAFEERMAQAGVLYRWVPASDLANPGVNGLSPTVKAIGPQLLALAGRAGCV